jgi:CSLREA domain-containing protein
VSPIGSSTSFDVRDLALDGGGNLFLTNNYNNTLLQEFLAVNGVLTTSSAVNTIAIGPTALAYDGQGHLFGATTLGAVTEYDLTTPSLSFGTSVPVGGSSTAESVTLQNEGSAPLVFATPSSGYNPATSSNFTLLNTSATTCPVLSSMTAPQSIAESSTCVLSYEFTPVVAPYSGSGVLTGTSVFTDNSASATTTATQSISLSGTATASGTYPTVSNSTFTIVPSKVAIGYSATAAVHETDPQGYAVYGAPVPVNVLNSSTAEVGGSYNQTYGTTDMNGNFTFGVTDTVAETVQVEISGSGGPTQSVTFVQPAYLVTTLTDDATGSASNCVVLATDNTNGNGSCSLRDAIAATNALPAGVSPTISFLSSLASSASPQTETVSSPLSISQNVIITGPGANALTLSGNNTQQIFYVSGGTVAINGLTLTKGVGALLQGTSGEGGAVWTSAISLTLTGDVLSYNTAGSYGGALYVSGGTTTTIAQGKRAVRSTMAVARVR